MPDLAETVELDLRYLDGAMFAHAGAGHAGKSPGFEDPRRIGPDIKDDLAEAEGRLRMALDLSRGQLKIALFNLALVLERQARLPEAKVALEEYLGQVPGNSAARTDNPSRMPIAF